MKYIFKKITVVFLAVVSASIFAVTAFADTVNGLSVSKSTLNKGDTFTVTISAPPSGNADTASIKVIFDNDAFEVVEWDPQIPGCFSSGEGSVIAVSAANVDRVIDLSAGITLNAEMRVRETAADGSYDFEMTENSFCYVKDNGYEFEELWVPETTKVTLTVCSSKEESTVSTVSENKSNNEITKNTDNNNFIIIIIIIAAVVVVAGVIVCIVVIRKRK